MWKNVIAIIVFCIFLGLIFFIPGCGPRGTDHGASKELAEYVDKEYIVEHCLRGTVYFFDGYNNEFVGPKFTNGQPVPCGSYGVPQ